MIEGVTTGWSKELELVGVGYRASNQGNKLDLALGFSHNIVLTSLPEVKVETSFRQREKPNYQINVARQTTCWTSCC